MTQPYGGFWIRVLAYIIDTLILQFATSLLAIVGLGTAFGLVGSSDAAASSAVLGVYGLILAGNWLYYAILESSSWQGTLGKQALNLVVTDEQGERIGFGRATGRYFAKYISTMIFLVGFMMVAWTGRKQGLHDMIAGTLVQRADSPSLARNTAKVFE